MAHVANALVQALDEDFDSRELQWISRIESLRADLYASTEEVEFTDYGAGSSKLELSTDEMYEGVTNTKPISAICDASKDPFWCRILFKLVRQLRPRCVVELGTCLGISAAYQAAAQWINNQGTTSTIEGAEPLADHARKNLEGLGLSNCEVVTGRFQDELEAVLKSRNPVDLAYIDGHHDREATEQYFRMLVQYSSKPSLIVLDDISWSRGMQEAWSSVVDCEAVNFAFDLRRIGLCVLSDDSVRKRKWSIPLL